ncbi:MAG: hypothetical protein LBG58_04920 [Planctomycetaceae bacterium]|jgi:hypothetical protein|nr:hypothetical protein [Planctomycetaceae bacterium]
MIRKRIDYKIDSYQKVSPENRWHGHDVFYVDGVTVSLDDTPAAGSVSTNWRRLFTLNP